MVDADLFIRLCGIAWRWGVAIIDNNGDVLLSSRCSHYCPGAPCPTEPNIFLNSGNNIFTLMSDRVLNDRRNRCPLHIHFL